MPLDTEGRIDKLLQGLHSRGQVSDTIVLYSEGVKTKLKQARFSLEMLRQLAPQGAQVQNTTTGPLSQGLLNTDELVGFYCDSFWDSLRSALDILGQLINELRSLGISERTVEMKKVARNVKSTAPGSPLDKALDELLNSRAFTQLEEYRHCSTHRRPPFILTWTISSSVTGTPGYAYSASSQGTTLVARDICTNPWDLKPKARTGQRPVVAYHEKLLKGIRGKIDTIVTRLP
jgi:hypothetical protein